MPLTGGGAAVCQCRNGSIAAIARCTLASLAHGVAPTGMAPALTAFMVNAIAIVANVQRIHTL